MVFGCLYLEKIESTICFNNSTWLKSLENKFNCIKIHVQIFITALLQKKKGKETKSKTPTKTNEKITGNNLSAPIREECLNRLSFTCRMEYYYTAIKFNA